MFLLPFADECLESWAVETGKEKQNHGKIIHLLCFTNMQLKVLAKNTFARKKRETRRKEAVATPSQKVLVLYQRNRYFSAYFHLISTLTGALKFPQASLKPGSRF